MRSSEIYCISFFLVFFLFGEGKSQYKSSDLDSLKRIYKKSNPIVNSSIFMDNLTPVFTREWIRNVGSAFSGPDQWPGSIVTDCRGNFITTIWKGFEKYVTIKYKPNGVRLWIKEYDGVGLNKDLPKFLATDLVGNIYVAGSSFETINDFDFAIIKYSSDGSDQWIANYNGPINGYDEAVGLAVDDEGNVYVTGPSSGAGTSRDFLTIKYDRDGVEQWVSRYDGPGVSIDESNAITIDEMGNSYVTGYSRGSNTPSDYVTIKYDPNGTEQWVSIYDGSVGGNDIATVIKYVGDGSVIVSGSSEADSTKTDVTTIKYDRSGTLIWEARYSNPNDDTPTYLTSDANGNIYVAARSGQSFFIMIVYDSDGIEKWNIFESPGNNYQPHRIYIDDMSNVYIGGGGVGPRKYNSKGLHVGGTDQYSTRDFALDGHGSVYLSTLITPDLSSWYTQITKFSQSSWLLSEILKVTEGYHSPGIDSVVITTRLPGSSNFRVDSKMEENECLAIETIQLYDDGLHHDGEAGDSLFGNIWAVPSGVESNYFVDLFVTVVDTDTITYKKNNAARFTTIGPIQYDDHQFNTSRDPYPNPGDVVLIKVSLVNSGYIATASEITADITSSDSCVTRLQLKGPKPYEDIPAGETSWTIGEYALSINENCSGGIDVPLQVDIFSENVYFWSDTFNIHIYPIGIGDENSNVPDSYSLSDAYPNPFNAVTTIEYALPVESDVTLIIYNLRGEEIERLVNGNKPSGRYKAEWNANNVSSGIYFYRITTRDFVQTKKMVLLK